MDGSKDHGLRVLLVEDDLANLKALGRLLEVIGHSVTGAEGVPEALSYLRGRTVDLLISDINLGSGSGLELIRHVRESSDLPAIAISGQPDMSGPSLASGFSAFLDKPVTRHRLQQTIRLVLSKASDPSIRPEDIASASALRA